VIWAFAWANVETAMSRAGLLFDFRFGDSSFDRRMPENQIVLQNMDHRSCLLSAFFQP
jgi:hypothetical protein